MSATTYRPPRRRWILLGLLTLLLGIQTVLMTPAASADGPCAEPPLPERINSGAVGSLDPAVGNGESGSAYSEYGYAGMIWHTYDVGDRITCTDPKASIPTTIGNGFFDGAKLMVGATSGLHYLVEQGGLASQLDKLVELGSNATYQGFAIPFLPIALLIVAIVLFKAVFAGKLADVATGVGRVAIALTFIAMTALSPLLYSQLFDRVLMDGMRDIEGTMSEQIYGPDTVARHVMPTTLHNNVVYDSWLRGEFGDENSKEADELGRKLLDAQAFTWSETRNGDDGKKQVVDSKQKKFEQVAKELEGTPAYNTFKGTGGDRAGAGVLAFAKAGLTTPIQFVSKAGILFAQLALRVLVLFGPLIGMFMFVNNVAIRVLRGVLGIVAFGIVFWAVATLHTYLMHQIMNSDMGTPAQLAVMGIITVLMWAVARPVRRIKGLATSSMNTMPGKGLDRALGWMRNRRLRKAMRGRRGGREWTLWDGNRFGQRDARLAKKNAQTDADDEPSTVYADVIRPEAAPAEAWTPPYSPRAGSLTGVGARAGGGPDGPPPPPPTGTGTGSGGGGPRGGEPTGGAGTFFAHAGAEPNDASRHAVRAEATRLHEPDGTTYTPHTGTASNHDTNTHALLADRIEADSVPESSATGGDVTDRDIVIPSEIERGDDTASPAGRIREARIRTDSDGQRVWSVYNPATDQVVDQPEPPARPEAQHDTTHITDNTPVKGDTDADSH